MADIKDIKVFIKGAGDIASGVAYRLYKAGLQIAMSELNKPLMVRRTVSFAEAIYRGSWTVEGVKAIYAGDRDEFFAIINGSKIPVITTDIYSEIITAYNPDVVIDGRMMKKAADTTRDEAGIVIGLGPGFTAGDNVDAVIETFRGHYLGRAIYQGIAITDTGIPGEIMGYGGERVVYAPANGKFSSNKQIGDTIKKGEIFGKTGDKYVKARIDGVIRGQIRPGYRVKKTMKIGDIDPRAKRDYCFKIAEKALAIGGGVLEAILHIANKKKGIYKYGIKAIFTGNKNRKRYNRDGYRLPGKK